MTAATAAGVITRTQTFYGPATAEITEGYLELVFTDPDTGVEIPVKILTGSVHDQNPYRLPKPGHRIIIDAYMLPDWCSQVTFSVEDQDKSTVNVQRHRKRSNSRPFASIWYRQLKPVPVAALRITAEAKTIARPAPHLSLVVKERGSTSYQAA